MIHWIFKRILPDWLWYRWLHHRFQKEKAKGPTVYELQKLVKDDPLYGRPLIPHPERILTPNEIRKIRDTVEEVQVLVNEAKEYQDGDLPEEVILYKWGGEELRRWQMPAAKRRSACPYEYTDCSSYGCQGYCYTEDYGGG